MKTIGKIIGAGIAYTVVAAAFVTGTKIAETVYENGLEDKITKVSKKLFQGKKES